MRSPTREARIQVRPQPLGLRTCISRAALAECRISATRRAAGMSSRTKDARRSALRHDMVAIPVMLPPGRSRLETSPVSTGSKPRGKTMAMVFVAAFAARMAGGSCGHDDVSPSHSRKPATLRERPVQRPVGRPWIRWPQSHACPSQARCLRARRRSRRASAPARWAGRGTGP